MVNPASPSRSGWTDATDARKLSNYQIEGTLYFLCAATQTVNCEQSARGDFHPCCWSKPSGAPGHHPVSTYRPKQPGFDEVRTVPNTCLTPEVLPSLSNVLGICVFTLEEFQHMVLAALVYSSRSQMAVLRSGGSATLEPARCFRLVFLVFLP